MTRTGLASFPRVVRDYVPPRQGQWTLTKPPKFQVLGFKPGEYGVLERAIGYRQPLRTRSLPVVEKVVLATVARRAFRLELQRDASWYALDGHSGKGICKPIGCPPPGVLLRPYPVGCLLRGCPFCRARRAGRIYSSTLELLKALPAGVETARVTVSGWQQEHHTDALSGFGHLFVSTVSGLWKANRRDLAALAADAYLDPAWGEENRIGRAGGGFVTLSRAELDVPLVVGEMYFSEVLSRRPSEPQRLKMRLAFQKAWPAAYGWVEGDPREVAKIAVDLLTNPVTKKPSPLTGLWGAYRNGAENRFTSALRPRVRRRRKTAAAV